MKRAMLEVVVSGAVAEPPDVERYIRCTLLAAMNDYQARRCRWLNCALLWGLASAATGTQSSAFPPFMFHPLRLLLLPLLLRCQSCSQSASKRHSARR
jgi:hypothetical protein